MKAVHDLLGAARDVVEKRARIAPAIVESSGLSPEGVELAFTKYVEIDATEADVAKLVASAPPTEEVVVILSSTVFVSALRAIAWARACAEKVRVRPSRHEPHFARALIAAYADPSVVLVETFEVEEAVRGEIHVYGQDTTIQDLRARAKVPVRGHGSGMGLAFLSKTADLRSAAWALAEDVVVFDQRGCLSPRLALVEGDADAFGEALHDALETLEGRFPRGLVPAEERAAAGRYVATMTYAARALEGRAHAIGIAPAGSPFVLPPPYRHVHVAACGPGDAARLVGPIAKGITTVGSDDQASARDFAPEWARLASLGTMQKPALDGPVDRRS